MRVLLVPPLFVAAMFARWFGTYEQELAVEHFTNALDDMLDDFGSRRLVMGCIVAVLAGYFMGIWLGTDLPPAGHMNAAAAVQVSSIGSLVIIGICLIAAGHCLAQYYRNEDYVPATGRLNTWHLFFGASSLNVAFGLGYFIVPPIILGLS